jgi:hypothetical protein
VAVRSRLLEQSGVREGFLTGTKWTLPAEVGWKLILREGGAEETDKHGGRNWRGVERGEGIYQTRAGAEAARKNGNFQAARTGKQLEHQSGA